MESGESDQSEALGVVLHSDRLNTHSMASVFVALLVETNMIVYKSRAKQLKRQTTSITMHTKKHVWKSCVIVFPHVPGERCFQFPLVIKCGRGDRIVYHGQRGMMMSLPVQCSGQSSGETGDEKNCCCCHRNNHHQVPVSLTLLRSMRGREDIRGQRSREAIFTILYFYSYVFFANIIVIE